MNAGNNSDITTLTKTTPHFAEKEETPMAIYHLSKTISLMDRGFKKIIQMPMRSIRFIAQSLAGCAILCGLSFPSYSFTTVTISTAASAGLETQFLSATTNQFQASLFVNPLFQGTYQINLLGINPNWNPPTPNPTTLEAALSLGATVYVYGFANGMQFERNKDLGWWLAPVGAVGWPNGGFQVNCSSPSYFNGIQVSSMTNQLVTIDSTTCDAVLTGVYNTIFQQNLSTPTVIPPPTVP